MCRVLKISLIPVVAMMLFSCKHAVDNVVGGYHPFVDKVLNDSTETLHSVLGGCRGGKDGSIALVGPADECVVLSDYFAKADIFDNVNGRQIHDGLPDFAGETVALCMDVSSVPYSSRKEEDVEEIALRGALFAVSDSCFSAKTACGVDKLPAKVVLLSSSVMAVHGYSDVDTLFASAGIDVPVISRIDALAEQALGHSGENPRIGVWAAKDILASGVYASAFHGMTKKWGHVDYVCYSLEGFRDIKDGFCRFLDMYSASSGDVPLSVLLLDDIHLSVYADELREYVEILKEDKKYSGLIAKDFRVVDALSAMAASTFHILRRRNLFTHKVVFPVFVSYVSESGAELEKMKYVCK